MPEPIYYSTVTFRLEFRYFTAQFFSGITVVLSIYIQFHRYYHKFGLARAEFITVEPGRRKFDMCSYHFDISNG